MGFVPELQRCFNQAMKNRKYINVKAGESFHIGAARVTLERKSGSIARLCVEADDSVRIIEPGKPGGATAASLGCGDLQKFGTPTMGKAS